MKARHKPSRAVQLHGLAHGEPDQLYELWHGEARPVEQPRPPTPVAPARRTRALVGAYALLVAGFLVALVGAAPLFLFFDTLSHWQFRGLIFVIAIGIAIIVQSTRLFDRVGMTDPLPNARLR